MPDTPDPPETHEITLGATGPVVRLTRTRLGDVPAGALVTRRHVHQLFEELTGSSYDVAMGLSLRGTRPLDPALVESPVWRVDILAGEGPR